MSAAKKPTQFDAVLAKNMIAREIRDYLQSPPGEREPIDIHYIIGELQILERYIGEMNQPSVKEIIDCSTYRL